MFSGATNEKIKSLEDLAGIIAEFQQRGKVVVHCHGVFDLVHPGHIRHFEDAKRQGDVLVVTTTPDVYVNKGPGRPVFNERLRAESLAALQVVDYVAVNRWPTAVETIHLLRPNVYVKGAEYANLTDLTGGIAKEAEAICEVGGRIYFTEDITFSSTKLLNTYFSVFSPEAENYLRELRQRYTPGVVIAHLKWLKDMRVLVVGDAIIDEYYFCRALGMASKSTTINAKFLSAESHAGGALCIANHVAGFCDTVHLVTCLGEQNAYQDFISARLRPNIAAKFFTRPAAPTTVKRRFMDANTRLFELSFLDDAPPPAELEQAAADYLAETIKDYDLTLVADFGHGFIGPRMVDVLCQQASYLAVNAQTNSANMGFNLISRYPRADYACLDERELRLACHNRFGKLEDLMVCIAEQLEASILTVTRGFQGSMTWNSEGELTKAVAFTAETVDATGAGDAYFALTAPCAAAGYPAEILGFVGNCAGAMMARVLGNRESINPGALYKFITTLLK
jgi:rfaE bifunctional protein nucleotidyltransferase chain/domain